MRTYTQKELEIIDECKAMHAKASESLADPGYNKRKTLDRGIELGQAMMAIAIIDILEAREQLTITDNTLH